MIKKPNYPFLISKYIKTRNYTLLVKKPGNLKCANTTEISEKISLCFSFFCAKIIGRKMAGSKYRLKSLI